MLIIGFSGGIDPVYDRVIGFPMGLGHDAAAVLLKDGEIVAAVEEERLNRIKHSDKRPTTAIRFCLESQGLTLADVDCFAYYALESYVDELLASYCLEHPEIKENWTARSKICEAFRLDLGQEVNPDKLAFVEHHVAHAISAFAMSGFDQSLVATLDAHGEEIAGAVFEGSHGRLHRLRDIPISRSLGQFYLEVIRFLGYHQFDEYKAMGLAPYGDPARYRSLFRTLVRRLDDGNYVIHRHRIAEVLRDIRPRKQGEPFSQDHKDLAAALQDSVESTAIHLLGHFSEQTGQKRLCLAGGVAQNCTMNGKILGSGLFEDVFVQPAAHDAGCALGAALHVHGQLSPDTVSKPMSHLYWGSEVGDDESLSKVLARWNAWVDFRRVEDIAEDTARRLADGAVIGWVQGRSEFGPRALGNRSILADPRPAGNKVVINAMVKKREAFRPFAPSVLEEVSTDYFDLPGNQSVFPYMIFTVSVKPDKRELLGAVTHVNGSARVQTVSRATNSRFWELLNAFGALTGVPVLLNTSFNNNVEPIVETAEDALVCFLTTELSGLVIGDYRIEKKPRHPSQILEMVVNLPRHVRLERKHGFSPGMGFSSVYRCTTTYSDRYGAQLTPHAHALLARADRGKTVQALLAGCRTTGGVSQAELLGELEDLWQRRLIRLLPRPID